jgi:hypothetical protein
LAEIFKVPVAAAVVAAQVKSMGFLWAFQVPELYNEVSYFIYPGKINTFTLFF